MQIVTCDVLVVGGGLAAVSSAYAALEQGSSVCLAVKGEFASVGVRGAGASGCGRTWRGRPRLECVHGTTFDYDANYRAIIAAGLGLVDRSLAKLMVEESKAASDWVDTWNVNFHKSGPAALGHPGVAALEPTLRRLGATILEETMIVDLLIANGQCYGAWAIDKAGSLFQIISSAVILATGGNAQLYSQNVHPSCVTGDGYAMALRAGAELSNLEFMQIFMATAYPTHNLLHVYQGQTLGQITNNLGEEVLSHYLPAGVTVEECLTENYQHAPFSTRDQASRYLAIAIVKEVLAGRGSPAGGLYYQPEVARTPFEIAEAKFHAYKGIKRDGTPMQITMAHQCSNGGLRINLEAMSTIRGLYAVGESATGMHGADRIGGNMLAACIVFGKVAGQSASKWAKKHANKSLPALPTEAQFIAEGLTLGRTNSVSARECISQLQASAWEHALVLRSQTGLARFRSTIDELRSTLTQVDTSTVENFVTALELRNLLLVGDAVALAANWRQESRGGHYREDYPSQNSGPPEAAVISATQEGSLHLSAEVIDPDWKEEEMGLGSQRWG